MTIRNLFNEIYSVKFVPFLVAKVQSFAKGIYAQFVHLFCNPSLNAKNSPFIAIDINSGNIRILELSKQKNHYRIENLICKSIDMPNNQNSDKTIIIQHLKNIIEKYGLKERNAALAISHTGIVIKTITLPSQLKKNELEEFMALNIEQHLDITAEQINFDYHKCRRIEIPDVKPHNLERHNLEALNSHISPNIDTDNTAIELIAAPKENVTTGIALLEACDLKATIITSDAYALARASDLLALNPATPSAIINLEDNKLLIAMVKQNKYIYAQEYFVEQRILQNTELLAKQINDNLQLCLATIEQPINTIVLCGTHAKANGLSEQLQSISNIDTTLANPLRDMDIAEHLDKSEIIKQAPAMTLCCGLALWEKSDFNLAPWRQQLHSEKQRKHKKLLYLSAALSVLLITIWHFTLMQKIGLVSSIHHKLLPQLTALEQQENQVKIIMNEIIVAKTKLNTIKNLLNNQITTVALLTNLSRITPPTIALFNLQKNNVAIIINGYATNLSSITEFMRRIAKISSFMQPHLQDIKSISQQEHAFTITTNLKETK